MRIRIDFVDAFKYTFEIPQGINPDKLNGAGKELENILIEDYFNGADKAVIYLGYSLDNEYFEFELMSNC